MILFENQFKKSKKKNVESRKFYLVKLIIILNITSLQIYLISSFKHIIEKEMYLWIFIYFQYLQPFNRHALILQWWISSISYHQYLIYVLYAYYPSDHLIFNIFSIRSEERHLFYIIRTVPNRHGATQSVDVRYLELIDNWLAVFHDLCRFSIEVSKCACLASHPKCYMRV